MPAELHTTNGGFCMIRTRFLAMLLPALSLAAQAAAPVWHQRISETNINVRDSRVTVGEVTVHAPRAGKVLVHFDGQCYSTVGDCIVLAASDTENWGVNDGNTAVQAQTEDNAINSFSHTRVYAVDVGTHTFYAVAHNYVRTAGTGIASVYGTLTAKFFGEQDTQAQVRHIGIAETRIDVRSSTVTVGQVSFSAPAAGKVLLRFDGQCYPDVGDRLILAASDDEQWDVNDGNVGLEVTAPHIARAFCHSRMYDIAAGNHSFYAVAHNYVESAGNGNASIYGSLTMEYVPDVSAASVHHTGIEKTRIDVRGAVSVLDSLTVNSPDDAVAVVHFDGACIPSVGDRIVLAANTTRSWGVNDGNVCVEAIDSDVNCGSFSHTRVYPLTAGPHTFYAVAQNYVEQDGNGEASIYASLSVEILPAAMALPDLIVSSLSVDSYSAESITYSYTIKNIGDTPVDIDGTAPGPDDDVAVQAYLSSDTVFNNTGDVAAGGTVVEPPPQGILAPGDSISGVFSAGATVDVSVTPYLILMVDWHEVVDESDESNNTLVARVESGTAAATTGRAAPDAFSVRLRRSGMSDRALDVAYTLPTQCEVRVGIYTVDGTEVGRHSTAIMPAGAHTFVLPVSSLPAGSYLCRIEAAGRRHSTVPFFVAR